ncbi:MAG TPA: restriction endonuclease [Candidatus Bathyarchaeia archaeon]|nr:restriction endonuclease [Candidatus Bathyarchaeia archaeon]
MHQSSTEETVRVLVECLKLSRGATRIGLDDLAARAQTNESSTRRVLARVLPGYDSSSISINRRERVQIAIEVARIGRFREAAKDLTWQEFEEFGNECLNEAGFRTDKNVRVNGDGRAWQIDIVGFRGNLVLTVDCKHWTAPSYTSRLEIAAEHQRQATSHLLTTRAEQSLAGDAAIQALALILTLMEPPAQFLSGAVLVPVERLQSFLNEVTPYDANLPWIDSTAAVVENPIRQ